jgi:hypothetical protein
MARGLGLKLKSQNQRTNAVSSLNWKLGKTAVNITGPHNEVTRISEGLGTLIASGGGSSGVTNARSGRRRSVARRQPGTGFEATPGAQTTGRRGRPKTMAAGGGVS